MAKKHSDPVRTAALTVMLEERRAQIKTELNLTSRVGRPADVVDVAETAEGDVQADIEMTLRKMKTETLARVEDALERLKVGNYGNCTDCGAPINQARLYALPFAARCRKCEQIYEDAQEQDRLAARRRQSGSLF